MTGKVSAPRFFTVPALVILLLSLVPFPVQAAGEGNAQRPAIRPSVWLQEAVPVPDQNTPAADAARWRLDDVYVKEYECWDKIIREEHGAFGLQSVSVACDFDKSHAKGSVKGSMTISYPDLMQGGQPATFAVEADGTMQWQTDGWVREASARLGLQLSPENKYRNICKHDELSTQEGGVTGSASLRVNTLTCTYDPAKDFLGANEVWIFFNVFPTVRFWIPSITPYYSSYGSEARVILIYKRCPDPNNCPPPRSAGRS